MHLSIPERLQKNLETRRYASGHMVYAVESQLHALHDNVAKTSSVAPPPLLPHAWSGEEVTTMKNQNAVRRRLAWSGMLVAAAVSACGPQADDEVPPADAPATTAKPAADKSPEPALPHHFTPEEVTTTRAR